MTAALDPTSSAGPLPERADRARLIVCERFGRWAVALRRELPVPGVRLYETRSTAECWAMLARSDASFVVVELTRSGARYLLERMAWLERDFPLARVAVVGERALASYEWLMREAGAVHFTVSPRELRPLACLAVRHLDSVPRPQLSLTKRIWGDLPWGSPEG